MSSDTNNAAAKPVHRRVPQQERSAARVEAVLQAAETLFAEAGYETTTMAAIAEHAGASIGSVYQYFPNKAAVGQALRLVYSEAMAARWSAFAQQAESISIARLAEGLITLMVEFMAAHPAYLTLLQAQIQARRDQHERRQLRERFAALFRARAPQLSNEEAVRIANVTLQIVKSMNPLYADANGAERSALVLEFSRAVAAYLRDRLRARV